MNIWLLQSGHCEGKKHLTKSYKQTKDQQHNDKDACEMDSQNIDFPIEYF
jgi:hypothetical protein